MKFKDFIKGKSIGSAMFMAIFYVVVMLGIFLAGYSALPGNIDRLHVAIVNEDEGAYGKQIAKSLEKELPFKHIEKDLTNKEAMKELNDNEVAMVVRIPKTFSKDLQDGKTSSSIDFSVNEASATAVSSTMTQVASQINAQLSKQFSTQTAEGILAQLQVPKEQAKEMAEAIQTSYQGNIKIINDVPAGMQNNMLPMFLTMSLYIGAMIGSMMLVGAFKLNRGKATKTRLFTYMQLASIIIGVIAGIASTIISFLLIDHLEGSKAFFEMWGQQALNYWVCFNFTAMFIFLLGDAGMIVNIPVLLYQTISNGATISYDMMYAPFQWGSHITPMFYSVQAYFANIFGNTSAAPFIWGLVAVGVVAMLFNIIIAWLLHRPLPLDKPEAEATAK
ncbi:ABC transporter permease [Kurthia gibsonii]|uniref:YhgE/Pip domain-containing protein n=1 Tax=Kurthia gibsonii TaxID=33946 RepID=UPI003983B694